MTTAAATQGTRVVDGLELPVPGVWEIDAAHSSVAFTARHLGLAKVRGTFERFSGTITVGEQPESSATTVSIDAGSVWTGTGMRDDHLRSEDFFDVERFPALTYRSTSLDRTARDGFVLRGELTIRGITKQVDLDVTYEGVESDLEGTPRIAFSAAADIYREDFGLNWNPAIEAGGIMIGKKVKIEIDVVAALAESGTASV